MNDDQFRAWLARLDKPESKALERWKYGNPANTVRFESEKKGGVMRRDVDEVQLLLDIWAEDMRRDGLCADDYPSKASGGFIHSWQKDFEDMVDEADAEQLVKINAAYDSLQRIYQDAICKHYGLGHQVWKFARAASFDDAKTVIRVKFVMKGLL